jgi:hypothetical protein
MSLFPSKKEEVKEDIRIWYEKKSKGSPKRTGRTVVVIKDQDYIAVGLSRCSKHDPFCRKIGRSIALGRARLALEEFKTHFGCADMLVPSHASREPMAFVVKKDVQDILTIDAGSEDIEYAFMAKRRFRELPEWLLEDRRI